MTRARWWAISGVLLPLLAPVDAHAQSDPGPDVVNDARAAYDAGARAFADKLFPDAARAFEHAARLVPNAVALFTAAVSWEHADRPAFAADDYARALGLGDGLGDKRRRRARDRLAALEPTLGVVRVTGGTGDEVRVDDDGPATPVPATLHVTAGAHALVVTRAADRGGVRPPPERRSFTIAAGAVLDIAFTSPPLPAPVGPTAIDSPTRSSERAEAQPASHAAARNTARTVGVVLVATGAAAEIGAAVLWWGAALGARDDYRQHRTADNRSRATAFETWTNVALIGGGALGAAGIACWVWTFAARDHAPRGRLALDLRPAGIDLRGDW